MACGNGSRKFAIFDASRDLPRGLRSYVTSLYFIFTPIAIQGGELLVQQGFPYWLKATSVFGKPCIRSGEREGLTEGVFALKSLFL